MAVRNTLCEVMKEYARQGLLDWGSLGIEVQNRAKRSLNNKIVETEGEFCFEIYKQSHDKFFPMPTGSYERQLNCCLFRIRNMQSFELFVLINGSASMAFRFEPADGVEWNHNYPHVQFCRNIGRDGICPSEIPTWIPENYPAFPLPSSDPLKMFLVMVTSVHGRSQGAERMLVNIMQKANLPGMSRRLVALFSEIFDE